MKVRRSSPLEILTSRIGKSVNRVTVATGTIETSYLITGSGQPIVLIHGAGAGGIAWYSVIDRLADFFLVVAPDVVGYGESDKPPAPYDRAFYSSWLGDFLDAMGLQQCTLIGHSQGGAIAMEFALDHPTRVNRLVLVCPAGIKAVLPLGLLFYATWLYSFPSLTASKRLHTFLVYDPNNIERSCVEYAAEVCQKPGGKRVFWRGRGKALETFPPERLGQISHRTLIVWGAKDRILPPKQGKVAVEAIAHARLHLIPDAGHIPFLDRPAVFNDVLIQFLSE